MIGYLICRILQLIFSAAILVLSVIAVKWQWAYRVPNQTVFATFVGAWGCLCGLVGLAAVKFNLLDRIFQKVYDGLTALLFLAGGIAYALALRGISCGDPDNVDTWGNEIISGGCIYNFYNDGNYACGYDNQAFEPQATRRCRQVEADAALLFLAFVVSIICMIFSVRATRSASAAAAAATAANASPAHAASSRA